MVFYYPEHSASVLPRPLCGCFGLKIFPMLAWVIFVSHPNDTLRTLLRLHVAGARSWEPRAQKKLVRQLLAAKTRITYCLPIQTCPACVSSKKMNKDLGSSSEAQDRTGNYDDPPRGTLFIPSPHP